MKKKVLFLTGTRADFGKLKPLIQETANDERFEYLIFATGMHMMEKYGNTIHEISKSGFENIHSFENQTEEMHANMDIILANTIHGLSDYVRKEKPDLIVVHGDRIEALAGAIVGSLNNIITAHIEGGEVSGTIDELIRHSVSKLAHAHFVANTEAKTRLKQMGEMDENIFIVGSPDIDVMLSDELPTLDEAKAKYDISFNDFSIIIYHPVTTELNLLEAKAKALVDAVIESNQNFVVIYPNNDSGTETIMKELNRLNDESKYRMLPSFRFEYFLTLLKNAKLIIGNSSAGIREAPVYGVPTINLGNRQMNRFKYESIHDVDESKEAILGALKVDSTKKYNPSFYFGNGDSAQLFIEAIRKDSFWSISHQKQFIDISFNE